ncbi:MAG: hypothetical protein QXG81_07345 [Ignisphaera sp.]
MNIRYVILSDPDIALKAYVIVPRDYADTALEKIVKLGAFEPISLEEKEKAREIEEYIALVENCKKLFDSINSFIEKPLTVKIEEMPTSTKQALQSLYKKLGNALELLRELDKKRLENIKKLRELEMIRKYLDQISIMYSNADISVLDYDGDLIAVKTFLGPKNEIELLKKRARYVLGETVFDEQNALATIVFDSNLLEIILKEVEQRNVKIIEFSKVYGYTTLLKAIEAIDKEKLDIEAELRNIENRIDEIIKSNVHDIALLKTLVDIEYGKIELLKTALESKYLVLLSGWVLRSRKEEFLKELSKVPSQIIFEDSPEPPVEFNNLKPFKPFEMFTELNGYPSPREWDPTPLLTYFYGIYFALMFPDIGYAIGLLIGSKYILPYFVQNPETLQKLRRIVYVTASSAIITGLLSGSFLGSLIGQYISLVLPPILPSPPPRLLDVEATVKYMLSSIKLALLIGYISILIAHIVALAKAATKTRDLWTALLEACMVLFIIFGPPLITYKLSFLEMDVDIFKLGRIIPVNIIEYTVYATLAIFILSKVKTSGLMGMFFWIFDVIGILADDMSFIRIAGIGAGSALLAEIFNSFIYSAIQSALTINIAVGIVVGLIMTFILHTFILGASVLGPYIHSLRLITYEMATKFYEGSGKRIVPLKIVLSPVKLGSTKELV